MTNAVVEEIEELGKGILSGDGSLRRKPSLCSGGHVRTLELDIGGPYSVHSPQV
jgi:hypothetical protein